MKEDQKKHPVIISIPQYQKKITVPKGSNLFRVLREHHINIAQSCEGDGICGTCFVQLTPSTNCTPPSKREISLKRANHLHDNLRISCLIRVQGDISISTTYW